MCSFSTFVPAKLYTTPQRGLAKSKKHTHKISAERPFQEPGRPQQGLGEGSVGHPRSCPQGLGKGRAGDREVGERSWQPSRGMPWPGGVVFGKEWGRGRAREEGERKGPWAKGQQGLNARKSKGSRHTLGNSLKFATGPQARTIKMFAPRTGAPEGKYVSCSLAFRSSNSHD